MEQVASLSETIVRDIECVEDLNLTKICRYCFPRRLFQRCHRVTKDVSKEILSTVIVERKEMGRGTEKDGLWNEKRWVAERKEMGCRMKRKESWNKREGSWNKKGGCGKPVRGWPCQKVSSISKGRGSGSRYSYFGSNVVGPARKV